MTSKTAGISDPCMQGSRFSGVFFLYMARTGLIGQSHPRNAYEVSNKQWLSIVFDQQSIVYLIVLPGKASAASCQGDKSKNFHNNNT